MILALYEAVTAGVTGAAETSGASEQEDAAGDVPEETPDKLSAAYIDPLDDLAALAERLPDSRIADGAMVFVDSFKGFTAQELAVLVAFSDRRSRWPSPPAPIPSRIRRAASGCFPRSSAPLPACGIWRGRMGCRSPM